MPIYNPSYKWPRRDVLVIEECPGVAFRPLEQATFHAVTTGLSQRLLDFDEFGSDRTCVEDGVEFRPVSDDDEE
jgi:hypothetical protein